MARKVLVRLVDDLDGLPSDDVATVTFSLDRVSYQIDLNESNASKLRDGLAEFVAAARRTGGRIKRGSAGARAAGSANDGPAIREWARKQGHQLAERGRIPSHIVDAYHAATGKGGRANVVDVNAKPARASRGASKTTAKTAAASRSAAGTTATASTRRTRSAKPAATKPAAKSTATKTAATKTAATKTAAAKSTATRTKSTAAKSTAEKSTTAKSTTAKAADKDKATTGRSGAAKAARTPRTTASTAAAKGTRTRRAPAGKSR